MPLHVIDELESAGQFVRCSHEVAAAVAALGLVDVDPFPGGFLARPRGRVGAVRVSDIQIEVRPKDKVGISSVFFLLGYASDPGFKPDEVAVSEDDDMFEAIAEALIRQTERAFAGGVLHGYVSVDETSRTLRGRIRMGDQVVRHFGSSYPVEITFDDYSPNIAENQIVASALAAVLEVPRLRESTRRRIIASQAAVDGVELISRRSAVPRWVPTRLNERYHGALRLAELVLRHQSMRQGPDARLDAAAFVVSMDKVFEDFVEVALREALNGVPGTTRGQYPDYLDLPGSAPSRVAIRPDVVHEIAGRPVIVADAKYKAASNAGDYPNAGKYQMLAYCTALSLDRAWLIYAQGGEPLRRTVRNAGIEIVEWPLDLGGRPEAILEQVAALVDAMAASLAVRPGLPGREARSFESGSLAGAGTTSLGVVS